MTDYPHTIQAALLLCGDRSPDLDAIVREFIAIEDAAGTQYKVFADTKPGVFYRLHGTNDIMVTIEHLARPAELSVLETALSSPFTRAGTPDARERAARHTSHILVATHAGLFPPTPEIRDMLAKLEMPLAGQSLPALIARMTLCATLSTIAHRRTAATLVHWTSSNQLMRGDMFEVLAAQPVPNLLHIHPMLFDGGTSADGRQQIEIRTVGASHFIGRDIHVAATPVPWSAVLDGIFAFVTVASLKHGYIVPDGDTFGPDDGSYRYRVTHVEEGEASGDFTGPLYRLDLLFSREHDVQAPDFIAPVRRFTDREVPPDVVARLGDHGAEVVKEWRSRRQMAEAAGIRFEVSTNRPAPPRGGALGWARRVLERGLRDSWRQ